MVKMVLSGKVNKELVSLLTRTRGKALGMCGIDGHMLTAERKLGPNGEDLGFVGDIVKVNEQPILDALNNGYIPVIATVQPMSSGSPITSTQIQLRQESRHSCGRKI